MIIRPSNMLTWYKYAIALAPSYYPGRQKLFSKYTHRYMYVHTSDKIWSTRCDYLALALPDSAEASHTRKRNNYDNRDNIL